MSARRRGTLFLVVGPSGAGKDTLIDGLRRMLEGDPRFHFPRRVITRPAEAGGEMHEAASPDAFAIREAAGAFCLSWAAHGLYYGIPVAAAEALAAGCSVVVNVSRSVVDEARRRFPPVRVIQVTASAEVLARRLSERGRETAADVALRLSRAGAIGMSGTDVVTVVNDGPVEQALAQMRQVLDATPFNG